MRLATRQIDDKKRPDLFQRQLFVLRAKASEVPDTDEWAGKVKAVVKRVDSLEAKVDEKSSALEAKVDALDAKLDAKLDAQDAKLDAKLEKILSALQLLLPEDAKAAAKSDEEEA